MFVSSYVPTYFISHIVINMHFVVQGRCTGNFREFVARFLLPISYFRGQA